MKVACHILFLSTLALLGIGMVALYSAGTLTPNSSRFVMQPIWCGLGLAVCAIMAWRDYAHLRKWSLLLLGVSVVLLTLVLIVGDEANGAKRWLSLGRFRMQPSEFAKLALIIALAHYGSHFQLDMGTFWKGVILPGAIIAPLIGLTVVETDVGAAALMAAVGALILILAGTRVRYLATPALALTLALGFFLYHDPVRSERIHAWLNPTETKLGKGMQAYESMVAFGKGGPYGVGLGDGHHKLGYIPEHHTDFILPVIGEEMGLLGTLLVVLGLTAIVLSGFYIAWHARESFGLLLASGISFLIGFQAIINIGVVTGSLPNKGLSLPFISYGGSNLIVLMAGIGLLLSVARHGGKKRRLSEVPLPSNDHLSYQWL